MNRKAVSEVVASLMIIAIATSVGLGLYIYSLSLFSTIKTDTERSISSATYRVEEKFIITYTYYDESNNILQVYIYCYGDIETKIVGVYVDSELVNQTKLTILPEEIKEYRINVSLASGTHSIIVVSERGNKYETRFEV